jgi:hypothetical protein
MAPTDPDLEAIKAESPEVISRLVRMYQSEEYKKNCREQPGFDIRPDGTYSGTCPGHRRGTRPAGTAESPSQNKTTIFNELVGELLECAVYFDMSQVCVGDQSASLVKTLAKASETVRTLAIDLGSQIGVTQEGILSYTRLVTEKMMNDQGRSCVNASVNIERYNNFCAKLSRQVDWRLEELHAGQKCSGSYKC